MEKYFIGNAVVKYRMSNKNPKAGFPVCDDDSFEAIDRLDCTTNAIANLTGDDFTEIFKRQLRFAEENLCAYNNPAIINCIMYDYGYEYDDSTNCMSGWVFYLTHQTGKYIVATASHLYALIDGVIYDSYDTCDSNGYILPLEIDRILCDNVVGYYRKIQKEDDA